MKKDTYSRREFITTSGKSAIAAAIIGPTAITGEKSLTDREKRSEGFHDKARRHDSYHK